MPDEDTATTDTTTTTDTSETQAAIVNADGTFSENWRDALPEEIRESPFIKNHKGDFHGIMKQAVHAHRMTGLDKVALPNDKSTDNDWDEFYRATGRPDTPDKYEFAKDESIADFYDDGLVDKFKEVAHKVGLNQKQMDALSQFEAERLKGILDSQQAQKETYLRELQEASDAKWGAAKEQRIHLGNLFINENVPEGPDRDLLLEAMGNASSELQIVISDLFATAAKKYISEHVAIAGQMNAKTPAEALTEAEALRATEGYMNGTMKSKNPARYKEITNKIQELYKIAHPGS